MKKLQWSTVDIPPDAVAAWTARAIYRPDSIGRPLDLLPDRMDLAYHDPKDKADFLSRVNGPDGLLAKYQEVVAADPPGSDSHGKVEMTASDLAHDIEIRFVGSPRESFGYFYVTAWMVRWDG